MQAALRNRVESMRADVRRLHRRVQLVSFRVCEKSRGFDVVEPRFLLRRNDTTSTSRCKGVQSKVEPFLGGDCRGGAAPAKGAKGARGGGTERLDAFRRGALASFTGSVLPIAVAGGGTRYVPYER